MTKYLCQSSVPVYSMEQLFPHKTRKEDAMAVSKEYVKEQLANIDSKKRRGVGKELHHLHEVINEGENILGHTRGFFDGNTWLICVTDRRLIFLDKGMMAGMKQTDMPLSTIDAVNYQTKMAGGNLTVNAGGKENHIGKMKKADVKDIANLISEAVEMAKVGRSVAPAAAPASSNMDELKKLAELKDAGVLSDEEFDKQKEKLLG